MSSITVQNVLAGIVPTYTGFDTTAPTNLSNATDESWTSATGYGKKTVGAAGDIGTFNFDLGVDTTTYKLLITGIVGAYSTTGNIRIYTEYSSDGITYYGMVPPYTQGVYYQAITSTSSSSIYIPLMMCSPSRYLRIRFYADAACDGYGRVGELVAYRVG